MSVARSAAEVLRDHVVLEVEAIDRMYLNVYVPHLQSVGAVVGYLRVHRGQRFASTTAVTPMTEAFVRNIDRFVNDEGVDLVTFQKGQRKDDVTQKYVSADKVCTRTLGHCPITARIAALTIIARSAPSPSSPAPSARRYSALGLDRSARPSNSAAVPQMHICVARRDRHQALVRQ